MQQEETVRVAFNTSAGLQTVPFEFAPEAVEKVNNLIKELDAPGPSVIVDIGFGLLRWVRDVYSQGSLIVVTGKDGTLQAPQFPFPPVAEAGQPPAAAPAAAPATPESVTSAPESVTSAPESVTSTPGSVASAPEANNPSAPAGNTATLLMDFSPANLTYLDGLRKDINAADLGQLADLGIGALRWVMEMRRQEATILVMDKNGMATQALFTFLPPAPPPVLPENLFTAQPGEPAPAVLPAENDNAAPPENNTAVPAQNDNPARVATKRPAPPRPAR